MSTVRERVEAGLRTGARNDDDIRRESVVRHRLDRVGVDFEARLLLLL
jgi:hypothetical protein